MNAFYLTCIIVGNTSQSVLKKIYSKNNGRGVYFFNSLTSFSAMIFFIIAAIAINGGLDFELSVLPYSIAFAVSFALSAIGSLIAISCGSLSLTSLIIQYSMMVPAFYGILFLNDGVSVGLIFGIILLAVSLVLINKKVDGVVFSVKWIVSVLVAFCGNGMCSVVQKMQQLKFDGAYKDEFMIMAMLTVCVIACSLSIAKERKEIVSCARGGLHLGLICGVLNGIVNLSALILTGLMPLSLMFPLISSGGIITTYIVSRLVYKESLSRLQFVGFILGIASIVLMNL